MHPEFKKEAEEKDKSNCCGKESLEFHRSEPRRGLPAGAPKVKGSGVTGRREEDQSQSHQGVTVRTQGPGGGGRMPLASPFFLARVDGDKRGRERMDQTPLLI